MIHLTNTTTRTYLAYITVNLVCYEVPNNKYLVPGNLVIKLMSCMRDKDCSNKHFRAFLSCNGLNRFKYFTSVDTSRVLILSTGSYIGNDNNRNDI